MYILYCIALHNIYPFNITTQHTHTYTAVYIYIHMYACVSTLSAPTRHSSAARRRHTSHTSLVDHFMFIVAARELSAGGFVGKPNVSECARAYVWLRVSRVHVRRERRRAAAEGARGMRVTCAEDLLRFTRGIPEERLPPLPSSPAPVPPATVPFPPRCSSSSFSSSCSSLILLLFLLYYDGLLHFHSDAGLKIKSLIHDA